MTSEEKQFLLKNLCARLPYGVQIYCEKGESKFNFTLYGIRGKMLISKITYEEKTYSKGIVSKHFEYPIYSSFLKIICKPYLRSMSSMTEEEENEWKTLFMDELLKCSIDGAYLKNIIHLSTAHSKSIDWLNQHHFDYCGLIEKGLAVEVTDENNPYEE